MNRQSLNCTMVLYSITMSLSHTSALDVNASKDNPHSLSPLNVVCSRSEVCSLRARVIMSSDHCRLDMGIPDLFFIDPPRAAPSSVSFLHTNTIDNDT